MRGNGWRIAGTTTTRPRRRPTARLGSKTTARATWGEGDRGKILKLSFVRPPVPGATRMSFPPPTAYALREVFDRRRVTQHLCIVAFSDRKPDSTPAQVRGS